MRLSKILCTAVFVVAVSSCGIAVEEEDRAPIGKADLFGSCAADDTDFCGGPSDGNCWCDDACEDIGDCCSDKADACGAACPAPDDPKVFYQSDDPETCTAIRFACNETQELFSNECGCGCVCAPADDPNVHYVSEDAEACQAIRFSCDADQTLFINECGCGCID